MKIDAIIKLPINDVRRYFGSTFLIDVQDFSQYKDCQFKLTRPTVLIGLGAKLTSFLLRFDPYQNNTSVVGAMGGRFAQVIRS